MAASMWAKGAATSRAVSWRSTATLRQVPSKRSSEPAESNVPAVPIRTPAGRLGLAPMLATASTLPPSKPTTALARFFQGALARRGAAWASTMTEEASLIAAS
jgi:hypothetical protein